MIEQKIASFISNEFNNGKPVSSKTRLADDLFMDSMDMFALKIELVVTFKVQAPEDDVKKFITVGDVIAYVFAKVAEKQKAKN